MEKRGYRIEQYEQAKPEGAVFDEVRYKAKGGLRVNYVIGTVKVDARANMRDTQPAGSGLEEGRRVGGGQEEGRSCGGERDRVGTLTVMVTWDDEGLCRLRSSNMRMPEFDLKLEGGRHESGM